MTTLVEQARERLYAQGGRMTAQRRLVIELLDGLAEHPTAEELYEQARRRDPKIHLSTVYRTLRWLQQEGLISSRWFAESERQERFEPNRPQDHFHFVCLDCGRRIEFFESPLTNEIITQFEGRFQAQVDSASLTLYGLCDSCCEGS